MRRLVVLCVILVASPAAADRPIALGLDYTVAHGGAFEAWDLGWRMDAGPFVRVGNWHATFSCSFNPSIESSDVMRDSEDLYSTGLGARLAYHLRIDGRGTLFLAAGFQRLWINSGTEVRRTCAQTGACIAGFYPETPDYDAWAPQLRAGIGGLGYPQGVVFGGTFEVIVEPMHLADVPRNGIRAVALYGAFTFTFGGRLRN